MRRVATPYGICAVILQKETHKTKASRWINRKIENFAEFDNCNQYVGKTLMDQGK